MNFLWSMDDTILKTLKSLERSKFRSKFKISEKDFNYIQGKGIETIRTHAVEFITSRIAQEFPRNDGKQTPMKNHPVFIAQHATATCCRGCIQKWHKIPEGKALHEDEVHYLVNLIMKWIELQMNRFESEK